MLGLCCSDHRALDPEGDESGETPMFGTLPNVKTLKYFHHRTEITENDSNTQSFKLTERWGFLVGFVFQKS